MYPNRRFQVSEIANMAFVERLRSPKLISRKIWVTEKCWIFHTVLCLKRFRENSGNLAQISWFHGYFGKKKEKSWYFQTVWIWREVKSENFHTVCKRHLKQKISRNRDCGENHYTHNLRKRLPFTYLSIRWMVTRLKVMFVQSSAA